jgi:hypothetical protein
MPAFWFTVQVGGRRIPVPLLLALPLALAADLLALVALIILGLIRKQRLFLRLATGFLLSRLTLALILYGRRFQISVRDRDQRVRIAGRW